MACSLMTVSGLAMDDGLPNNFHQALPLVNPTDSHTKLAVDPEGLAALRRITTPIAPVVVIGPYRSGKSFLLNQLLGVPCAEGFGVGHMRDTQTKGVWIWGEGKQVMVNKQPVTVVFLDTEGFESTGKSDAYDDRIFALSAIISSVLIYNLPETVKEADIEKLSFAAEIAEEFSGRVNGRESPFNPAHLLWLIQRDFLEGKSVQQMVKQALQLVPNPKAEKALDQVNRIRKSLVQISRNSTAFGLRQPHLQRTKLCELKDRDLDRDYVKQREQLKQLVMGMVVPKMTGSRMLDGPQLAQMIEDTVEALNQGEIPMAGSVVDMFNKDILQRCVDLYSVRMALLVLPTTEAALLEAHTQALADAAAKFEKEKFGRKEFSSAAPLYEKEYKGLVASNSFESSKACEGSHQNCEDILDALQTMLLPSLKKFDEGSHHCNATFHVKCVGPSGDLYAEKMRKSIGRQRLHFLSAYNQRLYNGLLAMSVVLVVCYRFVMKNGFLEFVAWLMFLFLEVYPKLYVGSANTFYESDTWQQGVTVWEMIAYNKVIDLEKHGPYLAGGFFIAMLLFRIWRWRRQRRMMRAKRLGSKDMNV